MNRAIASILTIAVLLVTSVVAQSPPANASHAFQLTVRNVTERQPITPPIVVIHNANTVLLPSSADRMSGLEAFAESGDQTGLIESLLERDGVKAVQRFGGIIGPSESATIINIAAESGDHVSVLAMLACTNDAITTATAIVTDAGIPAFGSGAVLDAGTEDNDESRANVPCLNGEGVSDIDVADGEGSIAPHPGISGDADLGDVFGWSSTAIEIVLDEPGTLPRESLRVGIDLQNNTNGQPITPPVVIIHDPNVDPISYTRPSELAGIANLSEGGVNGELIATLTGAPGVVSVIDWDTGGPIQPRTGKRSNVFAMDGTAITVVGMFACTNDGYIVATSKIDASRGSVMSMTSVATVFDSGAENNDETTATVPCLGGTDAALSEGHGENERREHPGITGDGDLNPAVHTWRADTTAELTVSEPHADDAAGSVPTALPNTGGVAPQSSWILPLAIIGIAGIILGGSALAAERRRR